MIFSINFILLKITMIKPWQYNNLKVLKEVDFGLYLTDEEHSQEILLPTKYIPEDTRVDDDLEVFIYHDSEGRLIATTLEPYAVAGEFAYLRVLDVSSFGAFLDMGIAKDLLVPSKEQAEPMKEGKRYLVYVYLDEETGRLTASARWGKFLDNENLTVKEGDKVELLIGARTDLGYKAIINNMHEGLLYENQVFEPLAPGDIRKGYIAKIREGNKIDLRLQAKGYLHIQDNKERILQALKENEGYLPLGDKSLPEEIYAELGISKKAYKKTIGGLYKEGLIDLEEEGIRLRDLKF